MIKSFESLIIIHVLLFSRHLLSTTTFLFSSNCFPVSALFAFSEYFLQNTCFDGFAQVEFIKLDSVRRQCLNFITPSSELRDLLCEFQLEKLSFSLDEIQVTKELF